MDWSNWQEINVSHKISHNSCFWCVWCDPCMVSRNEIRHAISPYSYAVWSHSVILNKEGHDQCMHFQSGKAMFSCLLFFVMLGILWTTLKYFFVNYTSTKFYRVKTCSSQVMSMYFHRRVIISVDPDQMASSWAVFSVISKEDKSRDMWFSTMWHLDKWRLRRASAVSF